MSSILPLSCDFLRRYLIALRATVTDRKDLAKLDAGIEDLSESLAPALWVDQLHLDRKEGDVVFQEERETAKSLCALLKSNNSNIPVRQLEPERSGELGTTTG